MSQVQLQVKPRRVRCGSSCEPPPFLFSEVAASKIKSKQARGLVGSAALAPLRFLALALRAVGHAVDGAFFLVVLVVWNAMHVVVWSYAFKLGPAADCFGLSCPAWLGSKVVIACISLAVLSYALARMFRRLGHRATSFVLLLLVTFDLAALMVLAISAL